MIYIMLKMILYTLKNDYIRAKIFSQDIVKFVNVLSVQTSKSSEK